jgi:hypothetical protein
MEKEALILRARAELAKSTHSMRKEKTNVAHGPNGPAPTRRRRANSRIRLPGGDCDALDDAGCPGNYGVSGTRAQGIPCVLSVQAAPRAWPTRARNRPGVERPGAPWQPLNEHTD